MITAENWPEECIRTAPPDVIEILDSIAKQVMEIQAKQFTEQGVF